MKMGLHNVVCEPSVAVMASFLASHSCAAGNANQQREPSLRTPIKGLCVGCRGVAISSSVACVHFCCMLDCVDGTTAGR